MTENTIPHRKTQKPEKAKRYRVDRLYLGSNAGWKSVSYHRFLWSARADARRKEEFATFGLFRYRVVDTRPKEQ